jgi:hypothetical protein
MIAAGDSHPQALRLPNAVASVQHATGSVDADTATLDAAAYADKTGLWDGNTAKVYVQNGPVGVVGRTGQLTNWINVYRTNTGFVHGAPGNSP